MIESILKNLSDYKNIKRFVVAYSGGLDSRALLHKVAAAYSELEDRAVLGLHVHHGLSAQADEWSAHCEKQCKLLGTEFTCIKVDANAAPGESPEAVARTVRYQAFRDFMQTGDCLLTAHHQDDQAETLLIQLLRGAGPRGLSAMPSVTNFGAGWHARPLLTVSRDELLAYAQRENLSWITDDSNQDKRFDRNYLRHEVIPKLKERFPGVAATLSRSANLCAEATALLVNVSAVDLLDVRIDDHSLSIRGLRKMGEVRARNLLHQWCRDRCLPTPSAAQLQCVWEEVIGAAEDSEPVVSWPGGEARRYRDALFIDSPLSLHDATLIVPWDGQRALPISGLGELQCVHAVGQGLAQRELERKTLEIRFRQGGEKLRPVGRSGHHALKKLFQEVGVPPWQRQRIPLVYADNQLLAVAGYWIAHELSAQPDEPGVSLRWMASN